MALQKDKAFGCTVTASGWFLSNERSEATVKLTRDDGQFVVAVLAIARMTEWMSPPVTLTAVQSGVRVDLRNVPPAPPILHLPVVAVVPPDPAETPRARDIRRMALYRKAAGKRTGASHDNAEVHFMDDGAYVQVDVWIPLEEIEP